MRFGAANALGESRSLGSSARRLKWPFLCGLWRVWNHRNLIVHEKPMLSLEDIFEWASYFIEEYQNCATSPVISSVSGSQLTAPRWVPPLLGRFLLNLDAAIDSSS
ncbi:hypothetical protein QYF36_018600 [Acer negundo]|nr:hypothetical protein QYF36_018600 [Acer negundo]